MTELITTFDANFGVFMVMCIGTVFVIGTVAKAIVAIHSTQSKERSRREIAAYIAEGSVSPEQGERLIKANVNSSKSQHA